MNIYKEFRIKIIKILTDLKAQGQLVREINFDSIIVEPPREKSNGELSSNVAMVVAKQEKIDPLGVSNR